MRDPAPPTPTDGPDAARPGRSAADRALAERLLSRAKAGRDMRFGKVRRLRAAVRARAYENDLKLQVALERLREAVREEAALPPELRDPPEQPRIADSS